MRTFLSQLDTARKSFASAGLGLKATSEMLSSGPLASITSFFRSPIAFAMVDAAEAPPKRPDMSGMEQIKC